MKFLIIVCALVAGCWYLYGQLTHHGGPIGQTIDDLKPATLTPAPPKPSPVSTAPFGAPVGTPENPFKPAQGRKPSPDDPKASKVYRFEHREPPTVTELAIATNFGCTAYSDMVSRSVLICGPVDGVDILYKFFREMDVVPGSCAVRSWAVYVDKSAQKGFDLAGAIMATSAPETTGVFGNGGLTLNLGVDQVELALRVIADGSVVEVVQRPHIQLQHGKASTVESIQEIPVPETSVSQGIAQTSINYRKVGLQLNVTPYFVGNGRVRLAVAQSNGLIGQNVRIGENEVPIIQSQNVSTSVEMAVGETVILGGVTTLRRITSSGLFHSGSETTEGTLYVVLSTYDEAPKARPVDSVLSPPFPPIEPPMSDPSDWILDTLLPTRPQPERFPASLGKSGPIHRR